LLPKPNPLNDLLDVEAGRNPSYANSLFLAFERGVFRAPGSLLSLIGWPLLTIGIALAYLVIGLGLFVLVRVHLIVFGVLGLLRPKSVSRSKSVVS
jgi:hypothetical protein